MVQTTVGYRKPLSVDPEVCLHEDQFVGDDEVRAECGHIVGHAAVRCLDCGSTLEPCPNDICGCAGRCAECENPEWFR